MVCVSSGPLAFKQAGCCITRIDDTWYVFGCLTIVLSGTWVLDVEFPGECSGSIGIYSNSMQKQIIQGQAHTLKKNGLYNRVYFPASFKKDKHLSCKRTQKISWKH